MTTDTYTDTEPGTLVFYEGDETPTALIATDPETGLRFAIAKELLWINHVPRVQRPVLLGTVRIAEVHVPALLTRADVEFWVMQTFPSLGDCRVHDPEDPGCAVLSIHDRPDGDGIPEWVVDGIRDLLYRFAPLGLTWTIVVDPARAG